MTNITITNVTELGGDFFFTIEWTDKGDFRSEEVCSETLQELLIYREDLEFSFDEEFEGEDGITIKQAIENNIVDGYATVAIEDDGQYDVYHHEIKVYGGDIEVNIEGEYIGSYKTEKAAMNKAKKIAAVVK